MADNDQNRMAASEEPREAEVTELDDNSLEEASGGLRDDSDSEPIVINNCNC